jgi:hypothetical protein
MASLLFTFYRGVSTFKKEQKFKAGIYLLNFVTFYFETDSLTFIHTHTERTFFPCRQILVQKVLLLTQLLPHKCNAELQT